MLLRCHWDTCEWDSWSGSPMLFRSWRYNQRLSFALVFHCVIDFGNAVVTVRVGESLRTWSGNSSDTCWHGHTDNITQHYIAATTGRWALRYPHGEQASSSLFSSSREPLCVPRRWLFNLSKRTATSRASSFIDAIWTLIGNLAEKSQSDFSDLQTLANIKISVRVFFCDTYSSCIQSAFSDLTCRHFAAISILTQFQPTNVCIACFHATSVCWIVHAQFVGDSRWIIILHVWTSRVKTAR